HRAREPHHARPNQPTGRPRRATLVATGGRTPGEAPRDVRPQPHRQDHLSLSALTRARARTTSHQRERKEKASGPTRAIPLQHPDPSHSPSSQATRTRTRTRTETLAPAAHLPQAYSQSVGRESLPADGVDEHDAQAAR
uniref:Uncharacterized protein n=1 Tax=Aegilops tauschii subsp. strangulata TaxID=200361 RepID=A0A453SYT8_AEGTS